jgi:hypothetical protein
MKLRDSANGMACTMNVAHVCSYNHNTVVLAHINTAGGAMGAKSHDYSACFSCSDCHDWLDKNKGTEEDRLYYTRRALVRTWEIWHSQGLLEFK